MAGNRTLEQALAELPAARRYGPLAQSDMGLARWTRWGVDPNDFCTLEPGFEYRFDIRPGPRSGPYAGDWRARSRA